MRVLASDEAAALIEAVGRDFHAVLREQGKVVAREIATQGAKQGVTPGDMPYLFWALVTQQELPDLGANQKAFRVAIDIMTRTGGAPNYQKNFRVTTDLDVDAAVDVVARQVARWADKVLLSALLVGYVQTLAKHGPKVPKVTGGRVPASDGVAYLNTTFRELLTMKSSWFDDGELLRRVIRLLPDW